VKEIIHHEERKDTKGSDIFDLNLVLLLRFVVKSAFLGPSWLM
jgi:hypothetical protein